LADRLLARQSLPPEQWLHHDDEHQYVICTTLHSAQLHAHIGAFDAQHVLQQIGHYLSHNTACYWATGRPQSIVQTSIDNSLCFYLFAARLQAPRTADHAHQRPTDQQAATSNATAIAESTSTVGQWEIVGFARAITDYAVFAYLSDLFVMHRMPQRSSLEHWLVDVMCRRHSLLSNLRRQLVATKDAHDLYRTSGQLVACPQPYKYVRTHLNHSHVL
jgi:hypothetical protein